MHDSRDISIEAYVVHFLRIPLKCYYKNVIFYVIQCENPQ